jgi:hypothetical protein
MTEKKIVEILNVKKGNNLFKKIFKYDGERFCLVFAHN